MIRVGAARLRASASVTPGPSAAIARSKAEVTATGALEKNPVRETRLSGASAANRFAVSPAKKSRRASSAGYAPRSRPTSAFGFILFGAALATHAGRARTRPRTSSGRRTASLRAIAAPMETPPTTRGARPRDSISVARSEANVAIENPAASPASDAPCPRHSRVTRRKRGSSGKTSVVCAASPQRPCCNITGSRFDPSRRRSGRHRRERKLHERDSRRNLDAGGVALAAQKGGDAGRFVHGKPVGHDRPVEARSLQTRQVVLVVEDALSRGRESAF